jgi:hypothetical protein
MPKIFITIFVSFTLISFFWYYKIYYSIKWIRRETQKRAEKIFRRDVVYLLIPVLNEVDRLNETIEYFVDNFNNLDNLHIVIVTTEKEKRMPGFENTIDLASKLALKYEKVDAIHYPGRNGYMAHQLNYAINNILKDAKKKNILFGVYNADSRPHPETIDWILAKRNDGYRVFQQYGDYRKNLNGSMGFSGAILKSAAYWQTRWSLGFEIYHALKQFGCKKGWRYPLNYCIGHGLFFTGEIFERIQGFSEASHNEDAIWGLELSFDNEFIMPVPFFDRSDSPDMVNSLFVQKSNWFWGPLQAFKYCKIIIKRRKIKKPTDKALLFGFALRLFMHAVYWVLGPMCLIIFLLLAVGSNSLFTWMLFVLLPIMFFWIPNLMVYRLLDNGKDERLSCISSFYSLLCYYLHGLSACRTIVLIAANHLFRIPIKKEKTEMKIRIESMDVRGRIKARDSLSNNQPTDNLLPRKFLSRQNRHVLRDSR